MPAIGITSTHTNMESEYCVLGIWGVVLRNDTSAWTHG